MAEENTSSGNTSKKSMTVFSNNTTATLSTEFQAAILIILEVAIVVGNTLTMLTVLRLRKRPLVVDVLIFSLSLADVMNAVSSVTIAILMRYLLLRDQEIPWLMCQAQGWCIVAFEMMSVFIISLICLDRFTAIVKPFWHLRHHTRARTVKAVTSISFVSFLAASCPLLGWDSYHPLDWLAICLFNYRSSFAIFIAIFGYIQLVFVLFSSVAIVYSLRKFSKRQCELKARYFPKGSRIRNTEFMQKLKMQTKSQRQSRQLAKIGLVVVVFFYMSWLPLMLCITIKQVSAMDISTMVFLASFLALSSPLANPFIYFLMWKRYRQAFVGMTRTVICRQHQLQLRLTKENDNGGSKTNCQPTKDVLLTLVPKSTSAESFFVSPPSSFTKENYLESATKPEPLQRRPRSRPQRERDYIYFHKELQRNTSYLEKSEMTFCFEKSTGCTCIHCHSSSDNQVTIYEVLETYV